MRRVDGRTIGTFWRDEVAGPWGLDLQIGLTESERARAVDLEGEIAPADSELRRLAVATRRARATSPS